MDKKTVSITIRVEEEIALKVTQLAEQNERSISYIIRKLLIEALGEDSQ
jgi:predicted transcriptional regulator|tara:strand:- start:422 stop:568 length:147 start_codon:yes stop_codon:yes gene_type:complete